VIDPEVSNLARRVVDLERRLEAFARTAQLDRSSVTADDGTVVGAREGILRGTYAAGDAASALEQLVDVAAIADSKVVVFYSDVPPTEESDNPEYGDQWLIVPPPAWPGTSPYVYTYQGQTFTQGTLLRYDGDTWLLSQQSAAGALEAAQSAQTTADGKIVTYWQAAAPASGSEGDLWYKTADQPGATVPIVVGVSRWSGGVWVPLPLTSGALAQGGVSPDRLTVGVVTNLVQDPEFLTDLRTPPGPEWTVLGPDTTYANANYLRCQDRTAGTSAGGAATSDTTWRITERIPVQGGQTLRLAAMIRCSSAAATGISYTGAAAPVQARLRVYFYRNSDPDTGPWLSGTAQIGANVLADVTGGVYDVWTPASATFTVPDGYTGVIAAFQVTNQTAGYVDYIKPEVQVLWSRVQSGTFEAGETGWAFDDETSQVNDLYVIGHLGASDISADSVSIGGRDLASEYLDPLPRGISAYAERTGTASAPIGDVETIIFEFAAGTVVPDRSYRLAAQGYLQSVNPEEAFYLRYRYTVDGTAPTTTSPILYAQRWISPRTSTTLDPWRFEKVYAGLDADKLRVALTLQRTVGVSTAFLYLGTADRNFSIYNEDVGTAGADTALAQKSYADATAPQGEPVQPNARTWPAVWGRSYDAGNSLRAGAETTTNLFQGYNDSTHGNTRSLFGFDYADIQATLAGATVRSIALTYRVRHAASAAGITLRISSHNYNAAGSSWVPAQVVQNRTAFAGQKEGGIYTQTLPIALGNEFKSGTTRGLGFGPAPNNSSAAYYGYVYGGPKLTITYSK
jgi:hypothetical protein